MRIFDASGQRHVSAVNIFLFSDRVHVATDGAAAKRGKFANCTNKCFPLPHLGLVVAARGGLGSVMRVRQMAERFQTVEAFDAGFAPAMKVAFGITSRIPIPSLQIDAFVAGVKNRKAFAYCISSLAHPGTTPLTPFEISGCFVTPDFDEQKFFDLTDGWDKDRLARTDRLEEVAIRVLEEQRKDPLCVVGAFAQLTTVTQFGIYTRIIKRWPDKIGQSAEILRNALA